MKTVASGNWPVKIEQPLPPASSCPSFPPPPTMHTSQGRYVLQCIPQAHRLRDQWECIRNTRQPCTREPWTWGKTATHLGEGRERGKLHRLWS